VQCHKVAFGAHRAGAARTDEEALVDDSFEATTTEIRIGGYRAAAREPFHITSQTRST